MAEAKETVTSNIVLNECEFTEKSKFKLDCDFYM